MDTDIPTTPRTRTQQAGVIALLGAGIRLASLFLPWAVSSGPFNTVSLNGARVGGWLYSIGCSAAALVFTGLFFSKRLNLGPRVIAWVGAATVAASIASLILLTGSISDMRSGLASLPYLSGVDVGIGVGPWVQL